MYLPLAIKGVTLHIGTQPHRNAYLRVMQIVPGNLPVRK
jgi:hypothetical protein